MTPRTCRLCHLAPWRSREESLEAGALCAQHCHEWLRSHEHQLRAEGIASEPISADEAARRYRYALEDFIARVLAEREVVRGRA